MLSRNNRAYWNHEIAPADVWVAGGAAPSKLEEYLFDLQGFILLREALSQAEIEAANECVEGIPRSLPRDGWRGWVHREDMPEHRGISYQQIYEAGTPFEALIAHRSYINYVHRFVGNSEFDQNHGPLFVDENFFLLRVPARRSRRTPVVTSSASGRSTSITTAVSPAARSTCSSPTPTSAPTTVRRW